MSAKAKVTFENEDRPKLEAQQETYYNPTLPVTHHRNDLSDFNMIFTAGFKLSNLGTQAPPRPQAHE